MFARKSFAIAFAMVLSVITGGLVATSSAQAAGECQATITGGNVADLATALADSSKTVICVSGTFDFSNPLVLASRSTLTIKGDPSAIFKSGSGLTGKTLLETKTVDPGKVPDLTIENIEFDGVNGYGRAISAQNITVIKSTFKKFAADRGSAIYVSGGDLKISNSIFEENSSSHSGGAVYVANNPLNPKVVNIDNSTFNGNTAALYGGAVRVIDNEFSISNSVFANNKVNGSGSLAEGGAVHANRKITTFNSTFYGNESQGSPGVGGAIYAERTGQVTYSTFLNNLASANKGNSIYKDNDNSTIDVGASIFASSSTDPELVYPESNPNTDLKFVDQGANLFKNTAPAEAAYITANSGYFLDSSTFGLSIDQIFGTATPQLADNGGPTKTIELLQGSVAINKAEPTVSNNVSYASKDQRGYDRKGAYDSGAFEFGVGTVVTPPTQNSSPTSEASTASSATSATTTKTLAATGSSSSTWGLGALAGLITVLGVSSLRSASRSRET